MTRLCIALLLLALPVEARQPKPAPKQPVAAPTAPAMAPQRTVEEDNQLKLWITDIMETADKSTARADLAEKHADAAEAEAKASRDQTAIAIVKQQEADSRLTEIQRAYDDQAQQLAKAVAEVAVEKKAKLEAQAHVSRIKTWLGFALGALLVLVVQYIPWGLLLPPWNLYGRLAVSAAAFAIGYVIVARVV